MGSFSNSPPAGVYGARVSLAGELLDGPAEGDGLGVSGTPPDYSHYVYPTMFFNGSQTLVVWNDNVELSGQLKKLKGLFIYPF